MVTSYKIIDERMETAKNALHLYIAGLFLSFIFTIVSYFLVTRHFLLPNATIFATSLLAVGQLFVQVGFFLHLHRHTRPPWNIIIFIFTILIVAFLVVGSLWIMYHLNMNMVGVSPFNSNEGYIPQ